MKIKSGLRCKDYRNIDRSELHNQEPSIDLIKEIEVTKMRTTEELIKDLRGQMIAYVCNRCLNIKSKNCKCQSLKLFNEVEETLNRAKYIEDKCVDAITALLEHDNGITSAWQYVNDIVCEHCPIRTEDGCPINLDEKECPLTDEDSARIYLAHYLSDSPDWLEHMINEKIIE